MKPGSCDQHLSTGRVQEDLAEAPTRNWSHQYAARQKKQTWQHQYYFLFTFYSFFTALPPDASVGP